MATLSRAEILDRLVEMNPDSPADELTLRRLAAHLHEHIRAQANIDEHGVLVVHPKTGSPMQNPYIPTRQTAEREIVRIMTAHSLVLTGLWGGDRVVPPRRPSLPLRVLPPATGRPTSLTPEVEELILARLREGTAIQTACKLAGIDDSTYFRWRKLGKDGDPRYSDFFERSEAAMVEWEEMTLNAIHADPDWKAKRAALELRRRQYRPSSTIEVTGPDGGPVQTALSILDQRLQSLGLPREVLQSMATPAIPTITTDTESPHWRDPEEEP